MLVTLAIVQLVWLPAYPLRSILMIVPDILIIGALVAIGDRTAWSDRVRAALIRVGRGPARDVTARWAPEGPGTGRAPGDTSGRGGP